MNGNFNAQELSQIINQITTSENEIRMNIIEIMNNFSSLGRIAASEDSSMSSTCNKISTTYNNLGSKMIQNLEGIKIDLTNYRLSTIQNEESTSQNLANINSSLESANSTLNSI